MFVVQICSNHHFCRVHHQCSPFFLASNSILSPFRPGKTVKPTLQHHHFPALGEPSRLRRIPRALPAAGRWRRHSCDGCWTWRRDPTFLVSWVFLDLRTGERNMTTGGKILEFKFVEATFLFVYRNWSNKNRSGDFVDDFGRMFFEKYWQNVTTRNSWKFQRETPFGRMFFWEDHPRNSWNIAAFLWLFQDFKDIWVESQRMDSHSASLVDRDFHDFLTA